MTFYDVIVCRATDPSFSFETAGEGWERQTETLVKLASGSLLGFPSAIGEGKIRGKQLDWGAWIVPMTKAEIVESFDVTSPRGMDPAVYRPFLRGQSDEEIRHTMGWDLPQQFAKLRDDEQYYVIAFES